MNFTYKTIVTHYGSDNTSVLLYADTFEECYQVAWFWYAQTNKTAKIMHNMTLAHILDAN